MQEEVNGYILKETERRTVVAIKHGKIAAEFPDDTEAHEWAEEN